MHILKYVIHVVGLNSRQQLIFLCSTEVHDVVMLVSDTQTPSYEHINSFVLEIMVGHKSVKVPLVSETHGSWHILEFKYLSFTFQQVNRPNIPYEPLSEAQLAEVDSEVQRYLDGSLKEISVRTQKK